jgi:pimeloyl-ACP methyl ester carboxylesterase
MATSNASKPLTLLTVAILAITPLVSGSAAAAEPDRWSGDGGVPAFYRWEAALPAKPGVMLRTEAAPAEVSLPGAGRAQRILYSFTVSGIVFFPKGTPPTGGWPLIAWAHGTTGIADVCAPSFMARSSRDRQYLGAWLADGYAIVATDYQGLGTPGPHPYLQTRSEAYSVLDSARAALQRYPRELSNRVLAMGHSQGSGAALAAARVAPVYAPELNLRGTVATGIVAHTRALNGARQEPVPSLYASADDPANAAYEILYFLGTVRSMDPQGIAPEDYVSDAAWPILQKAQTACMGELRTFSAQLRLPVAQLYKQPINTLEARADALADFPDVRIATPVFTATGLADADSQPVNQYNFISAMCAARDRVEWRYYPHTNHGGSVMRSRENSVSFVRDALAGRPTPNLCPALVPPGSLETPEG